MLAGRARARTWATVGALALTVGSVASCSDRFEAGSGGTTTTPAGAETTTSSTSAEGGGGFGAAGDGGEAGAGGALPERPRSCRSDAVGAGYDCGATHDADCCASPLVTGGDYNRSVDFCGGGVAATVSDFRHDRFEVTVGRFRQFYEAYDGTTPPAGIGEHEKIPGTGWQTSWPHPTKVDLGDLIQCGARATWTPTPGANEHLPMNCLSWYEAFLFCAWDGGRLPTEAEYNYAAAGGALHLDYPWGNTDPTDELVVYTCQFCQLTPIQPVGSKPLGVGQWGQLDLAGNVEEWCRDTSIIEATTWCSSYVQPCDDCAELTTSLERIRRGGSHADWYTIRAGVRRHSDALTRSTERGVRCARPATR